MSGTWESLQDWANDLLADARRAYAGAAAVQSAPVAVPSVDEMPSLDTEPMCCWESQMETCSSPATLRIVAHVSYPFGHGPTQFLICQRHWDIYRAYTEGLLPIHCRCGVTFRKVREAIPVVVPL